MNRTTGDRIDFSSGMITGLLLFFCVVLLTAGAAARSIEKIKIDTRMDCRKDGILLHTSDAAGVTTPAAVSIFDVKGLRVRDMAIRGEGETLWDGKDYRGRSLPAGIYFYQYHHEDVRSEGDDISGHMSNEEWTRSGHNPVIPPGEEGEWDDQDVYSPTILTATDTLRTWYTGFDGTMDGPTRIGYAWSTDGGESWQKYHDNPVLKEGGNGEWDDELVEGASVLYENGAYKMWYCALDELQTGHYRIGYATSSDGVTWNRHMQNPVLDLGTPGSFDDDQLLYPSVVKVNGIYHMYYVGMRGFPVEWAIGHAVSEDGVTWQRENRPGNEPVLSHGDPGDWDEYLVSTMGVLHDGGYMNMWYSGSDANNLRIGFASSLDGVFFTKKDDPVFDLGIPGEWDDFDVYEPSILKLPGSLTMLYSGRGEATYTDQIGLATRDWTGIEKPGLKARVIDEGIWLEWNMLSSGFVLCTLERRDRADGFIPLVSFSQPSKTTNYIDRAVEDGKTYTYRFRAHRSNGDAATERVSVYCPPRFAGSLLAIAPNPMNPQAKIEYTTRRKGRIRLSIYNVKGEAIRTLVDDLREGGTYTTVWYGRDDRGRTVSSGVYYCILEENGMRHVKKIVLLR
jgi:predicted GH43/DUF377 family glycosyl hydrolase